MFPARFKWSRDQWLRSLAVAISFNPLFEIAFENSSDATAWDRNRRQDFPMTFRSQNVRRWTVRIVLAAVVTVAWCGWHFYNQPLARADRLLIQARQSLASGDLAAAETSAAAALDLNSSLFQAAFLAADCAVEQGEYSRAIEYAGRVKTKNVELQLRALLMVARLTDYELHRMADAESAWRSVLDLAPSHVEASSELARLLFRSDRRSEAIPVALNLIRSGYATDLIVLMGSSAASIDDQAELEKARATDPGDTRPLTGLALLASVQDRNDDAISLLRQAIAIDPKDIFAHAALGQRLLDGGNVDLLDSWQKSLPEQAETLSGVWVVLGKMADARADTDGAIRCYWEACLREPESLTANSRLARLLAEKGRTAESEMFAERVRLLGKVVSARGRVLSSGDSPAVGSLLELARHLEAVGQFHEASGWCVFAVEKDPDHVEARQMAARLRHELTREKAQRTGDQFHLAKKIDLSAFPRPSFQRIARKVTRPEAATSARLSFRDESEEVGLTFRYCNGAPGEKSPMMYDFTGGGIGVLDYDLDGFSDAVFSQGHPWGEPVGPDGTVRFLDTLFRNHQGKRFENVSSSARIDESGFGQGVTIGDYNSDGFPDVFVANIGQNQLWINRGDGTFSNATREVGLSGDDWTTSCVMVDLTGDGHPDLYEVNYLTGSDVFERVCTHEDGSPRHCAPFQFDGADDRLWINDGEGRFVELKSDLLSAGKGLGVAAWDISGRGRLDLFVANDTTPNLLFQIDRTDGEDWQLKEYAIGAGVAVNENGKAEGGMGIALGDADGDGKLDALVTNFLFESNTLYMNVADGFFEDRTREQGLELPSMDVLGFGTQFLDADLDGALELFVANGNVDDLSAQGRPWRMPAQIFRRVSGRFVLVEPSTLGEYFQNEWLGRAVARCDWNRDGKDDLFIGHLLDASSLLTNTTAEAGRFLSIRLFGVQSPRDAIGTTIEATVGDRTIVRQLTAGDGYQASNERRLIFGTGTSETIRKLVVRWPSGRVQTFDETPTNQEVWLVEGGHLVPNGP